MTNVRVLRLVQNSKLWTRRGALGSTSSMTCDSNGNCTYNSYSNPLLVGSVSNTDGTIPMTPVNNSMFATQQGAQQIAQQLGGAVVQIPTPWQTSTPMYGIQMPNGTVVNAGAVATILGNDAAYANDSQKQAAIDQLINGPSYGSTPTVSYGENGNAPFTGGLAVAPYKAIGTVVMGIQLSNLTTGNNGLFIGGRDQWKLNISNAQPNSPVSVTVRIDGGPDSTSVIGTTDGAGNFSKQDTMPAQYGNWVESWFVNGVSIGTISFSVVVAQSQVQTPNQVYTTNTTQQSTPTSTVTQTTNGGASVITPSTPPMTDMQSGLLDIFTLPSKLMGIHDEPFNYTALVVDAGVWLGLGILLFRGGRR